MSTHLSPRDNFDQLIVSIKEKESCAYSIVFNINESIEEPPYYVSLSEVLKSEDNYAFPLHLNGFENKEKLLIALRVSAIKAGF